VPGVGPGRRRLLLRHFGSLRGQRAASRDDLRAVPGLPVSVADAVFEALGGTATLPP
jgi:excinuclease ABC subunit C